MEFFYIMGGWALICWLIVEYQDIRNEYRLRNKYKWKLYHFKCCTLLTNDSTYGMIYHTVEMEMSRNKLLTKGRCVMILARVKINDGDEPIWKLLNCSQSQFQSMAQKRFVQILNAHEITLDFVIEAIQEKLNKWNYVTK